MDVTPSTYAVAIAGIAIFSLLGGLQFVAVLRPKGDWVFKNVYGGDPGATDPKAYFAFNIGFAWADAVFWLPLQLAASVGMMLGENWGFLLAIAASTPFWYTAIQFFVWDRALGIAEPTFSYWVIKWAMFPVFGIIQLAYAVSRML